jgi:hypothetical protein
VIIRPPSGSGTHWYSNPIIGIAEMLEEDAAADAQQSVLREPLCACCE